MQLNPSEISELIKSKIQNLQGASEVRTQGTVVSVTDGICRVRLNERVKSTLEIESGSNDPMAILLVTVMVEILLHPERAGFAFHDGLLRLRQA